MHAACILQWATFHIVGSENLCITQQEKMYELKRYPWHWGPLRTDLLQYIQAKFFNEGIDWIVQCILE